MTKSQHVNRGSIIGAWKLGYTYSAIAKNTGLSTKVVRSTIEDYCADYRDGLISTIHLDRFAAAELAIIWQLYEKNNLGDDEVIN